MADAALECGHPLVAFLDDSMEGKPSRFFDIVGKIADLEMFRERWPSSIPAVGDNRTRLKLFGRLRSAGYSTPSIVHPTACISCRASIADGAFVAAGAVINIGADIHEAAIINTGATVDHNCVVGTGAHISPGAHLAGDVFVGEGAWVGIGSSIRNGVRIGAGAIVGAGAVVIRDVPDDTIVMGVPARPQQPGFAR